MIKTIGGMQEVLNSYNAKDWLKSAEIGKNERMSVSKIDKDMDILNPLQTQNQGEIPKSFSSFLVDSMTKVNDLQKDANVALEELATGQSRNLHETMLAVEKAEIAFKTMNQIRMKVIDAYKEIMKMQI